MAGAPGLAAAPAREDAVGLAFDAAMASFESFEHCPHLAVAVSGGGDSMALALLADGWARGRGGRITALTVDHGLRPEAAAEAAQVASWCRARGIEHVLLRRAGPALSSGIQAKARTARYRLLEAWCRERFVLHLLLAHQREDQVETVLMRIERGSNVDGLAGMSAVAERGAVRLLRPLLGVPRERLRAFLRSQGQGWIEDPSNRNPAFTRVRIRERLAAEGGSGRLAAIAAGQGIERQGREALDAQLLARRLALHPAGFVVLDADAFAGPEAIGIAALAAMLLMVSGGDYPPRRERLARLHRALAEGLARRRTLGGCLIAPGRWNILFCREPAAVAGPMPLPPGGEAIWDRRFRISLDSGAPPGLRVGALGRDGPALARGLSKAVARAIPAAVRATLPALCDAKGVVAVPSLGYFRSTEVSTVFCRVQFRPNRSATGAGFTIV